MGWESKAEQVIAEGKTVLVAGGLGLVFTELFSIMVLKKWRPKYEDCGVYFLVSQPGAKLLFDTRQMTHSEPFCGLDNAYLILRQMKQHIL